MAAIDTLKDKWDAITPRERMLVVAGGIAAVATVLFLLATSIVDRLDAMSKRNDKMRRALSVLSDYRVRGRTTEAKGPEITATPVKLESYLDKQAKKVGITVPSYKPRNAQRNGFNVHTVEVNVTALEIEKVKEFLEAIETDNKLVAVTSITLKRSFSDKTKLDLKVDVSTYSLIAAAGTGSGTGTGTAVPAPAGGGAK